MGGHMQLFFLSNYRIDTACQVAPIEGMGVTSRAVRVAARDVGKVIKDIGCAWISCQQKSG